MRFLRVLLALVLLLTFGAAASAQTTSRLETTGSPADPVLSDADVQRLEQTRIFVLTFGPGPAVWERFGHNALWVLDPQNGESVAYNWGMFSFGEGAVGTLEFLGNFARGRLNYWMEGFDGGQTIGVYESQGRSVDVQELDLTPIQKARLIDHIGRQDTDATRYYLYDYYRDNCSTRVRDAIDAALDGRLKRQLEEVSTHTSYRWHTRRALAGDWWALYGTDFGMGPRGDRPISAWEECFIPEMLRQHLGRVSLPNETTGSRPLLLDSRRITDGTEPPLMKEPPLLWAPMLLIGMLLGGVITTLALLGPGSRTMRLGVKLLVVPWWIFCGVGGLVLVYLSLFSDHWAAAWNANILLFSPVALLVLPGAVWLGTPPHKGLRKLSRLSISVIAALSLICLFIELVPGNQANLPALALAVPINLACMAIVTWNRSDIVARVMLEQMENFAPAS